MPVTEQTGPTEAPEPPDAQTEVVDGRLQVATGLQVDGVPVVLVPEVYSPDGNSVVELVAEQSPRPDLSATGLAGSSVVVTADDATPGWTVAAVVRPDGTYTGQVIVYGVLPPGASEVKATLPDAPDIGPIRLVRVDGSAIPEAPEAWGPTRDLFVLSATAPELADAYVDTTAFDVEVGVRVRIDGEWVDLPR